MKNLRKITVLKILEIKESVLSPGNWHRQPTVTIILSKRKAAFRLCGKPPDVRYKAPLVDRGPCLWPLIRLSLGPGLLVSFYEDDMSSIRQRDV